MTASTMIKQSKQRHSINKGRVRWQESLIHSGLGLCALISIITTATIIFILGKESFGFFQQVAPTDFLFGTSWVPMFVPSSFGVLPLLWGTLVVTFGAALISIPIGLASAIYLSEYASPTRRAVIKPMLELLAGIPTVVYGYFALTFVTPVLKTIIP
jgi:phosphate transport system permease protein